MTAAGQEVSQIEWVQAQPVAPRVVVSITDCPSPQKPKSALALGEVTRCPLRLALVRARLVASSHHDCLGTLPE